MKKKLLISMAFMMVGLEAKEETLKEKVWIAVKEAVKDYIKQTDTYKFFDYSNKKLKRIKKKVTNTKNKRNKK